MFYRKEHVHCAPSSTGINVSNLKPVLSKFNHKDNERLQKLPVNKQIKKPRVIMLYCSSSCLAGQFCIHQLLMIHSLNQLQKTFFTHRMTTKTLLEAAEMCLLYAMWTNTQIIRHFLFIHHMLSLSAFWLPEKRESTFIWLLYLVQEVAGIEAWLNTGKL